MNKEEKKLADIGQFRLSDQLTRHNTNTPNPRKMKINQEKNERYGITRSSWLNCALRDDEAVYWVSIGHCEALAIGNWLYWVSRGHLCLYILHKVEIWTGVTDASLTTLKDRATQLLIKYKSGALVTQFRKYAFSGGSALIITISHRGGSSKFNTIIRSGGSSQFIIWGRALGNFP